MVRVQGKGKYASGKGYYKIDEKFKTKKQADAFIRFLVVGKKGGAEKGTKITEYKKPKRVRQSFGFGFR